jgi:DNA-binding CsgD family transcriptional regulator
MSTLTQELTPIELRAATLLSMGHAREDIAWTLGISEHEVDGLRTSIRDKTGLTDPGDLWSSLRGCAPWAQNAA